VAPSTGSEVLWLALLGMEEAAILGLEESPPDPDKTTRGESLVDKDLEFPFWDGTVFEGGVGDTGGECDFAAGDELDGVEESDVWGVWGRCVCRTLGAVGGTGRCPRGTMWPLADPGAELPRCMVVEEGARRRGPARSDAGRGDMACKTGLSPEVRREREPSEALMSSLPCEDKLPISLSLSTPPSLRRSA